MTASNTNTSAAGEIKVWDIGVRFFHWALVACVAVAMYTGFWGRKSQIDFHVYAGAGIAALIAFRLIWGVLGTTYARFSNFVCSPVTAIRHLGDLKAGRAHHNVGHNPLGAWMIVALLLVLIAVCVTGVVVLGGVVKEGPLAAFVAYADGRSAKEIHELIAYALGGLIVLHILGAIFESVRTRENLARAMVTGRKRVHASADAEANADHAAPVTARPVSALIAFGAVAALAVGAVMHFGSLPAKGVPTAALDPAYAKECGACHTPHHPTVAPAATWQAIFTGLKDHFGENASLDPALSERLAAYAVANSSEHWDTRVANVMRKPSAEQPLRITDAPVWKRIHDHFPEALFKSKAIGGKLNCTNCHSDAETGVFGPRYIAIKKEPQK